MFYMLSFAESGPGFTSSGYPVQRAHAPVQAGAMSAEHKRMRRFPAIVKAARRIPCAGPYCIELLRHSGYTFKVAFVPRRAKRIAP